MSLAEKAKYAYEIANAFEIADASDNYDLGCRLSNVKWVPLEDAEEEIKDSEEVIRGFGDTLEAVKELLNEQVKEKERLESEYQTLLEVATFLQDENEKLRSENKKTVELLAEVLNQASEYEQKREGRIADIAKVIDEFPMPKIHLASWKGDADQIYRLESERKEWLGRLREALQK